MASVLTNAFKGRLLGDNGQIAAAIDCDQLGLIGGRKRKNGPKEKDYECIAKTLNKIGKMSNDYGVKTTYQAMDDYAVARMDELDKLLELIDPDLVQLTFDTGHWAIAGGDPAEAIKKYRDRIINVHFRDLSNGKYVEFGTGELDFVNLAKLLKSLNYQEWIIFENGWRTVKRAGLDPFESAKRAKKYIDKYISNII